MEKIISTDPDNSSSKPLRILLADDDLDDCQFFKKALEELKLNTNLTIVNDGDQLMQLLTNETAEFPNIVFLDINMPRKNGYECLAEIKQNKKLADIQVVMFSTSFEQDKISMLFKMGAHVYARKPGDFAQLKQVIHHALPIATEEAASKKQLKYILNA